EHLLVRGAKALAGVHQQQNEITAFQCRMNFLHHLAVQAAVRLVHARCVDEDNLSRGPSALRFHVADALDIHPRGLWLFRNDGNLLAHQRVEQRALAGVGAADYRHEAGAVRHYARTWRGEESAFFGCDRQTLTFSTLRSVDSRISKRSPSSSITSPGCGMRPAMALTRPPTVAVSCQSRRRSKRSCRRPTSTVPCIT